MELTKKQKKIVRHYNASRLAEWGGDIFLAAYHWKVAGEVAHELGDREALDLLPYVREWVAKEVRHRPYLLGTSSPEFQQVIELYSLDELSSEYYY